MLFKSRGFSQTSSKTSRDCVEAEDITKPGGVIVWPVWAVSFCNFQK